MSATAIIRRLSTPRAFLSLLFLGLFAMAARHVIDPDVWWHLSAGQYIVEHRSIPHTDPFSYTRGGQPWVAHEWLTELLLYGLLRATGFGGLIIGFAAVLCAAFFALYSRCGGSPYMAGVSTLVGALATMPLWGVRPQLLSLLLTSLWLLILERAERNSKLLWWTLPLMLLWVNLHAGFALGLALSMLFLLGDGIENLLARSPLQTSRLKLAALVLLLNLLIVPINPNFLRMFSYPIETLRSAAMQNYIAEWASPNFHHAEYWPFLLLILGTFATLGWSSRSLRPRDLLLLVVSLYAGLCSIRMMPVFVLIAVPVISQRVGNWPLSHSRLVRPLRSSVTLVNAAIVLSMAVFAGLHTLRVIQSQPRAEVQHFPAGAARFLQSYSSGRIFNHYDWGGYLIWKLHPATPVFIDGRADLYGKELLDQFAKTYQLKDGWQQTLRDWKVETVVIPPDSALASGLRNSPGWAVRYEDKQAIVLTAPSQISQAEVWRLPLVCKKLLL
jgi:hypothetical protein